MTTDNTYQCPIHNLTLPKGQYCPECMTAHENARPASEMTPEERAQEIETLPEILTIPWDKFQGRASALVGRDLYEIKMLDLPGLAAEIRSQSPKSDEDAMLTVRSTIRRLHSDVEPLDADVEVAEPDAAQN